MDRVDWRAEARRYAAPVAFLALLTAALLVVRGALRDDMSSRPAARSEQSSVRIVVHRGRPAPQPGRFYVVQRGDTLGAIAGRRHLSVERLLELNPGVEPTALRVGQRLRVA